MMGGILIILLLHDACPCIELPTHLYFLPLMGVRVVGLRQFIGNPLGGYLKGSGLVWDGWEEAATRTLGHAPPAGTRVCWGLLLGVCSLAVELRTSYWSGAEPSVKKWVRSAGRSNSAPNSLSVSNQACFLSFLLSVERHLITMPCPSVVTWGRVRGRELVLVWVWRGGT